MRSDLCLHHVPRRDRTIAAGKYVPRCMLLYMFPLLQRTIETP